HRFLTEDRSVATTRFGDDVTITVNYGTADYRTAQAVLPQYGFLIQGPTLTAFYARNYGSLTYGEPTLFVVRSLDGRPLSSSRSVRIYRAFGDRRIEWKGKVLNVETEQ